MESRGRVKTTAGELGGEEERTPSSLTLTRFARWFFSLSCSTPANVAIFFILGKLRETKIIISIFF